MTNDQQQARRRSEEAADWFTRLSNARISNASLNDFWAWRKDPLNRAAYEKVEDLSSIVRSLRDDPDIQAATRDAETRTPWWRRLTDALKRSGRAYALGGALAAGIAVAMFVVLAGAGDRYSTGVGQQTAVTLADGSRVRLNTDSRLRARFDRDARRLVLERGQAFFEVAHDGTRPFIVDAGRAQVRAVGTRFDVRRAAEDVEVTLAQGRVEVTPAGADRAAWTLTPGQQIRIDRHSAQARPATVDVAAATAWTSGRIFFRDAPLEQAVAEVNRYSRHKIVLAAGAPRQVKINGAFDTGDTEGFATAAAESLDLAVARRQDGTVELRPHDNAGG